MKFARRLLWTLALVLTATALGGCGLLTLLAPLVLGIPGGVPIQFDLAGAVAVAATDGASRGLGDVAPRAGESTLVKILEDGTTQDLIDFGTQGVWMPNVAFLSVGDDGSIYICFDGSLDLSYQDETSVWNYQQAQFLRVYPDETYDIVWPPPSADPSTDMGSVAVWSLWGVDSDPLAKGPDGLYYFLVEKSGVYTSEHLVYRYDSAGGGEPVLITPENALLYITRFMVDSRDHLFIQSDGGNGGASYLRMYSPGTVAPVNIYYSTAGTYTASAGGFTMDPQGNYILMNGYGIRGLSGMIRVDIAADDTLTYRLQYPNPNSEGSWVYLAQSYGEASETALIEQKAAGSSVYEWALKETDGLDLERAMNRLERYFWLETAETLQLSAFGRAVLQDGAVDADLNRTVSSFTPPSTLLYYTDGSTVDVASSTLAEAILWYPEEFLRTAFDNDLFKDWLALPENSTLASIDFGAVGTMTWTGDGLYALYGGAWWGGASAGILKLLDQDGNPDIRLVELQHPNSTSIRIVGDWLYYRYDILDADDVVTGFHRIARRPLSATGSEEEVMTDPDLPDVEILTYDVSSHNDVLYFVGFDLATNTVVGGKIMLDTLVWSPLDTALRLTKIRIIE